MPNISKTGVGSTLTFEDEVVRMLNIGNEVYRGDILATHLESLGTIITGVASTTWAGVSTTDGLGDQRPKRVIGVAMEGAANGEYLRVGFRGVFECACDDDADEGVLLRVSNTAGRLAKADTAPDTAPSGYITMLGIALEDTAVSGDLTKVLFDGLNGFTASHP